MVGPMPLPPQSQAAPSAEEEALKRNTDCVYFLASPLTCKKGSKCEYRHSDMARLNPRDCWYWLNGNCLNPKCAFRHPPLDGFMEAQIPTIRGSSVAPVVSVASTPQVPYAASKQGVPCIFFQQGLCINGDKCAFTHAPNFFSYKAPQPPNSTASSEIPTAKKAFGGVEKSLQGKKLSQTNNLMPRELPKPVGKLENYPTKNDNTLGENVLLPNSVINREHPMYKPTSMPMYKPTSMPSTNGNPLNGPKRVQQPNGIDDRISMQNKDDEISREPSPGFDVLVDDELRGSDYYHGEDQYGGMRGNGGRNEYDMGDSADYDSVADIDRDMYCDGRGYDSYDRLHGSYAWEQLVVSSDRIPRGSAHLERRPRYDTEDTPEQAKMSDLRHQLSKHRRGNSLKSVISHAFASERHVEDRANSSRRDTRYLPPHDSSLCGRLRGRIKLPVRSSFPADRAELRLDRQMERVRDRGRLSSERPQLSSYQGRLRDRIKRRVREDFNNGGRNNRGPRLRRDIINDNSFGFSGPRSLTELKGRKTAESNEQNLNEQHLGKRKFQKLDNGEDISFEGPMPLQEILKRKRGGGTGVTSGASERKDQNRSDPPIQMEESKLDSNSPQETKLAVHQSPLHHSSNEVEAEEEMTVEGADARDHVGYDQRDGDDDYEPVEGEGYNLDEAGEEYLDDDDDDFAKKLGVVSS